MSVSISELVSRTLSGVGDPAPEICSLEDATGAVAQALGVRTAQSKGSDTNVILSKSTEFSPNQTDYEITSLIGAGGTPVGLEFADNSGGARYVAARVCGINQMRGGSVAFYAEETSGGELRQFVRFSTIPEAPVRIYYDSDGFKSNLNDVSVLPDSVSELVVLEAQNRLIPRIKLKYAMNMNRNEQDRKDAQFIMATFDGILSQNMMNIPPLEQLWRVWSFRSDKQTLRAKRNGFRPVNLYE